MAPATSNPWPHSAPAPDALAPTMRQTLYSSEVFNQACGQFDRAADLLQLEQSVRDRTKYPKRCLAVTVPVRRDSGEVVVYEGYRVQHHLSIGPTKGGTRFHPAVNVGEVAALAMWMSWKCALAGLPYGGAKGGVAVDPHTLSEGELERLSRRYMQEVIPFVGPQTDIMAPDMGTNEKVMAWFMDTYSQHVGTSVPAIVTGKPVEIGGSDGRREATGRGVAYLAHKFLEEFNLSVPEARIVVQGFGNVGGEAALAMREYGCKVVAISDVTGGYHNPRGLDLDDALAHQRKHRNLGGWTGGDRLTNEELLTLECEVLIPAALERVITPEIAPRLRCKILAEGANGPTTNKADAILEQRGDIEIIPDIFCNAGGVIVSYFEWVQDIQSFFWTRDEVMDRLYRTLDRALFNINRQKKKLGVSRRLAALTLGIETVAKAKALRGLYP